MRRINLKAYIQGNLKAIAAFVLVVLVFAIGAISYQVYAPLSLPQQPYEFTIEPGSGLMQVASNLKRDGVLTSKRSFLMLARLRDQTNKVRFGTYLLEHPVSQLELLDMICEGRTMQSQILIIEGTSFRDLRKQLAEHPRLKHDSAALSEAEILQRIGATESAAEGLFFPDTYVFPSGSSDFVVLKHAYQTMKLHLEAAWQQHDPQIPLRSAYEALILASIVEKETGRASDRPMIASVFINRLKRGMRLQTDPTVIYGMGEAFDGNLRKRDLKRDTPYNTYTRYGLPPTPIALPSLASIEAVMQPPASKALYFVARGDGSSHFSPTLIEHNKAVKQFQLKK